MRRIAFVLVFALGTVAAAAEAAKPPVAVTIAARPTGVTFGGTATLSGTVSSQQANERVTVEAQACGQNAFKAAVHVTSTAGGAWTATVKPTTNTQYRAQVKKATSAAVTVGVHPAVQLAKVASHKYRVRVSAAQSFAGKVVTFQRFKATTGQWVRVRRATLRQISAGPVVVSGVTFRSRIAKGRRVRVVLPAGQTAPCYLSGVSNLIRS